MWPESFSFKDDGITSTRVPTKWRGVCDGGEEFNSSLCNYKLIGARYFNKSLKQKRSTQFQRRSRDSARDTLRHGTYLVSSIAAGNCVNGVSYFGYADGTERGVAPHAKLAKYEVLWNEGMHSSDILAGIDRAIADGVDVISLSIHDKEPWHNNSIAIASFSVMEKGIMVVYAGRK